MKPDERVAKLEAAYRLLREETTTFQKFEEIRTLIKGINPQIDKLLVSCSRVIKKIKKVQNRKIIELSLEVLPEKTKEQKKRKKALLLFLSSWRQLCSEVERVKKI